MHSASSSCSARPSPAIHRSSSLAASLPCFRLAYIGRLRCRTAARPYRSSLQAGAAAAGGGAADGVARRVTRRPPTSEELNEVYLKANSLAELYGAERPVAIPLSEHRRKARERDLRELSEVGRRRGMSAEAVREALQAVEALLPDVLDLTRMKASEWITVLRDAPGMASRLIALKQHYPTANVQKVVALRPRVLLTRVDDIARDAKQVHAIAGSPDLASQLVQLLPELMDPQVLARSLAYVRSTVQDGSSPVQALLQHPELLRDMGESNLELTADYSELVGDGT